MGKCFQCGGEHQGTFSCMLPEPARQPLTNEHTGEEYLGKDRDELRAIIVERDIAIEQLHAAVKTAQELAATRLMEIEQLRLENQRLQATFDGAFT